MFGIALNGMVRRKVKDRDVLRALDSEYRDTVGRSDDIGMKNNLLSSYVLAAYFIAMCRTTGLTPEQNRDILAEGIRNSRMVKVMLGSPKSYFSDKRMEGRREWSRQSQTKTFRNDWMVDFIEGDGIHVFGLDYRECGVCKLCADEGCPELAKYLCSLDHLLVDVMGIGLDRTTTLAEGGDRCDFRFRKL